LRKSREQFAQLYEERLPYYRKAKLTVHITGKNPATICTEIENGLCLGSLVTPGNPVQAPQKSLNSDIGESQ